MLSSQGVNYAPQGKPQPVCRPGEFVFSAVALDHGHVWGMCNGLIEAGGTLRSVWGPDPAKVASFLRAHPGVKVARSEAEVLDDPEVALVASAAVTNLRCDLGLRVMDSGKDYFTDKAPLTTLEQLGRAQAQVKATGKKYAVYYSERLHVEGAVYAGQLIEAGVIGKVLQVTGFGPHRRNAAGRHAWFFDRPQYGGICDIGSHQIEQYLHFAGVRDATVVRSQVANYGHPEYPGLEDFGEALLVGDNQTSHYFRVDWFTPDGLSTWGDGRTLILGAEGCIEIRKYVDIARDKGGDHVYLVDGKGEHHFQVHGQVGYPYFGALILDCLNRTENAMTQEHAFKAAELCVRAEVQAVGL